MNELSLYLLDIMQNSIKAKATIINLDIIKNIDEDKLTIKIVDNGCGMSEEVLSKVLSPFYTTRTTRKVGLGLPLFKELSELCEGSFKIESKVGVGTTLTATFRLNNIDLPPFGNWVDTFYILVINDEDVDIKYTHKVIKNNETKEFVFDTIEIKNILDGMSIKDFSLMQWAKDYIKNGLEEIDAI
ncbi:MAG: ATP-binding protein [Bacilli bacterium]|nr:ATP-binding protein [Bacilli bacterium]MBO7535815.1 ATP-binding protein [Bacilli bacterium]